MKSSKLTILALFWLLLLSRNSDAFLKTQGREIVDSYGQKVLLRGFGLGGWLVQEGYQLHIPGFGSPSSIRKQIVDLIGEANAEQFYQRYIENYVTEQDIAQIASWGVNSVRLPFNYRLLTPENQPGVYLEEGFQIIDRLLSWCEKYRLYLILDMHCAPGGQNKDNISDSDGIEARLWTDPANQERTIAIWRKIAERYAAAEWIAGYDLLNEPVMPAGYTNNDLRSLYIRIARAIREVDKNHILFIEGNWYATDFNLLTPPFDVNMVYSFHKYWNENTQAAIQKYLNIRNQTNCPLWLGESGENSNTWFYDCVQLMEQNNIGWNWWTHKKVETTTSPYSVPISPNYQRLIDYWDGKAEKPSSQFAMTALLEMADRLKLENCEFHPDVLDALLRSDFGRLPIPFKNHILPDTIFCVDYDMGRESIAYHDADYQVTHGLGSEEYNRGHKYRNDGVDVEPSDDPQGAKFSVGWTQPGEWLLFTIAIRDSGRYKISFRIASPQESGKIQLLLDNRPLTDAIQIPKTGGWKNWQTLTLPVSYPLPSGTHQLKVLFLEAGFNINYILFNLEAWTPPEGQHFDSISNKIYWAQNYPNPFQQSTNIPFMFLDQQTISLKIFNLNGAIVKNLFNGPVSPGYQTFIWNGTNSQGQAVAPGLYFCQLHTNGVQKTRPMILLR